MMIKKTKEQDKTTIRGEDAEEKRGHERQRVWVHSWNQKDCNEWEFGLIPNEKIEKMETRELHWRTPGEEGREKNNLHENKKPNDAE